MMFFQCVPKHPHVLQMQDLFVSPCGSDLCLVFEYCTNSLSDVYLRAQGFLDWSAAWQYSHQILQGIAHLHANDVSHRDLSVGVGVDDKRWRLRGCGPRSRGVCDLHGIGEACHHCLVQSTRSLFPRRRGFDYGP